MGTVDDDRLTQLGNRLRRFANGETRSHAFVNEIEGYVLENFRGTDLFDDLAVPLASYSPAGGEYLYDDAALEKVFRAALERISALCGGLGQAYLTLIERHLNGQIGIADFGSLYWPMRRKFFERGMWFEGKLGEEVDSFDTDVDAIGDTYRPIGEEEFRERCRVVAGQLRRVLL